MNHHKDEITEFKKTNQAIVMIPIKGSLTANSRKFFNVLLAEGQAQLRAREYKGQPMLATELFTGVLIDLIDQTTDDKAANKTTLFKGYVKDMQSVRVEWTAPDQNNGVIWTSMALLSEARLAVNHGTCTISWSFPPSLVSELLRPNSFTLIKLKEMARLKSYEAVALYEIASRFIDNPSHMTCTQSVDWWMQALSRSPRVKSSDALRLFKSRDLLPAITEINEKTSIHLELIQKMEGTKHVGSQFKVLHQKDPLAEKTIRPSKPEITLSPTHIRASKLEISGKVIDSVLRSGRSHEEVDYALEMLKIRIGKEGEGVRTPERYFLQILKNVKQPNQSTLQFEGDGDRNENGLPRIHDGEPKALSNSVTIPMESHNSSPTTSAQLSNSMFQDLALIRDNEYIQNFMTRAKAEMVRIGLSPGTVKRIQNWESLIGSAGPVAMIVRKLREDDVVRLASS